MRGGEGAVGPSEGRRRHGVSECAELSDVWRSLVSADQQAGSVDYVGAVWADRVPKPPQRLLDLLRASLFRSRTLQPRPTLLRKGDPQSLIVTLSPGPLVIDAAAAATAAALRRQELLLAGMKMI